jgi:hypothetical protein
MYLNGFHFYADDMGRQIEAHHLCRHVTEDFFQCDARKKAGLELAYIEILSQPWRPGEGYGLRGCSISKQRPLTRS